MSQEGESNTATLFLLLQRLAQKDCGNNSCLFAGRGKGGMRTNGNCQCYQGTAYDIINLFCKGKSK